MRSGTPLYNKGLSLNILKRCWPVWSCYLAVLLFMLPVNLATQLRYSTWTPLDLWVERRVLESGCSVAGLSFFFSIVCVMAAFGFLYSSRTCGMICSMPVKRQTLFMTAWLTGIVPMLAADVITALVTMLAFPKLVSLSLALRWLGLAVMGNAAYYGFGVFCAMLTGSLLVLPLVYGVLSLTAYVVEGCAVSLLNIIVYGFTAGSGVLRVLSPAVMLMESLGTSCETEYDEFLGNVVITGPVTVSGLPYLVCVFAAGLLFSFAAMLLFKKRRMESAGDTVAITVLKPVFKYCMTFGTALVFACAVYEIFYGYGAVKGPSAAVLVAVLMVAGAFIGYFASVMMMKKTVRVFGEGWKGFIISAAICAMLVLAAELDVTGYEKRLPDITEADHVEVNCGGYAELYDRENLAAALETQKAVISEKRSNERGSYCNTVTLRWVMKDGSSSSRSWNIAVDEAEYRDAASGISHLRGLMTCREAAEYVYLPKVPVNEDTFRYSSLYIGADVAEEYGIEAPEYGTEIQLTKEEALALYYECVLPDLEAGRICNDFWLDYEYGDPSAGITFSMELDGERAIYGNGNMYYDKYAPATKAYGETWFGISVLKSSALTLERIGQLLEERGNA